MGGVAAEWDPETDPHIAAYFSPKNLTGKAVCKAALQEALGLNQDPNAPIVAFIGRLAPQKGIDVIEQSYHWLISYHWLMGEGTGDTQLVMMGSGQAEYADFMRNAENQYKGRVCGYVGFSPEMEHAIIAGADILVMPSRYEPCGLPQMYAQRYGTIPIVHATGGLQDSVDQFAEKSEEAPSSGTGCNPKP
ncbi:hypothetical protein T484DRAFT_1777072 [Baffinella frigidus]|nr:hypothetical protein T484DRAFT_1777072 [Cryptophyta sp. CCMP2293]